MQSEFREALTFDDVLLVPKRSSIASRMDVDLSTQLSKNIRINIPLVSANMSTVTESATSIAMAQEGGLGIIHRNLSIEREVEEVKKVKRSENTVIEHPFMVKSTDTIEKAIEIREKNCVSGLVVVSESGKVLGMLTNRDLFFRNGEKTVSELMTSEIVTAPVNSTSEEQIELMKKHKVEKIPLVDGNENLKGLVTARDVLKKRNYPKACRDKKGRLRTGAAIGISGDYKERAKALVEAEADLIAIDVAHGHMEKVIEVTKWLERECECEVLAGNVATAHATRDLIQAGADVVKVGVGGGSICVTRVVAGTGVPNLTAILNCAEEAHKHEVPIMADQGMRTPGDVVKAIAAGASSAMSGYLFAGTKEAPGRVIYKNGKRYKLYHGMASWTVMQNLKNSDRTPEGVESTVPYKGPLNEIVKDVLGGLRSGMSYSNARTIPELWKNAEFVKITSSGLKESHAHDVEVI